MENQDSVEWLYRQYFPLIREKCRRMLGNRDEALDVAQETFTRMWRDRTLLAGDSHSVIAWIYRTATRLAIDRLRARRLESRTAAQEPQDRRDPESLLSARRDLLEMSETLAAQDLQVVVLSRVDGLAQLEIARVLGISERTVRRSLKRASAALKLVVAEKT